MPSAVVRAGGWGAAVVRAFALVALALPLLYGFGRATSLRIYPGPADPAYTVDLPARYRVAEPSFFRWTGREAGLDLPYRLAAPATLRLAYTLGRSATPLTLKLGGETVGQVTLVEGSGEVRFVLPAGVPLRLRFLGEPQAESLRVAIWGMHIDGRILPSPALFARAVALPVIVFGLLLASRIGFWHAWGLALSIAVVESLFVRVDPYGSARLAERLVVPVFLVGGAAVLVARRGPAWVFGAFLSGLVLRLGIVLHPFAYHYDHAAHVRFVDFLLENGVFEFWRQKAELQVALNIGELTLAGQKLAFPYPTLFYLVAAPLARVVGSIDLAVMTLAAGASALEVFLVAALAKALLPAGRRPVIAAWAAALYPAGFGILTIALYPSLVAHVAETAAMALLARDFCGRRAPFAISVIAIIVASALHVSALIHLALFALLLAGVAQARRPLLLGGVGLVASLLISYRSALALVPSVASSLGDLSFSRYWLQLEPPQSFSFMGGWVWPAVGLFGLLALRRAPHARFLLAWGLSFLLLRGLRLTLGPAGAHLKELQWVAPLVCLGIAESLERASEWRYRSVAPVTIFVLAVMTLQWTVEHERWLWPLRELSR